MQTLWVNSSCKKEIAFYFPYNIITNVFLTKVLVRRRFTFNFTSDWLFKVFANIHKSFKFFFSGFLISICSHSFVFCFFKFTMIIELKIIFTEFFHISVNANKSKAEIYSRHIQKDTGYSIITRNCHWFPNRREKILYWLQWCIAEFGCASSLMVSVSKEVIDCKFRPS